MFDKPYRLRGVHAKKARELVAVFDGDSKAQFFKYAKDIYAFAPLVGYLYNRRAELDHTKSEETGDELDYNIMAEQVLSVQEELTLNYCLIMLLDSSYESNEEERLDKAFRYIGKKPEDEARFDEYVRGGIDVLYEKLIEGKGEPDDYVKRLYDFLEEIQERFNNDVDVDNLMALCVS